MLQLVTLSGRYTTADGQEPMAGEVEFLLSTPLSDAAGNLLVAAHPVTVALDETGGFVTTLVATDDPAVFPTGTTYRVTERLGTTKRSYDIELAHAVPTADLADIVPALPVPELVTYARAADLDEHADATTGVHGIADTAELVLAADLAGEAAAREDEDEALAVDLVVETAAREAADALLIPLSEKGAGNGVATLGPDGKLPSAQVPALALGETFTVASEAEMLALVAQRGDVAQRTDLDPAGVFILTADDATVAANWLQVTAPGAVLSVNGQAGAVVLPADGAAPVASLRTLGVGAQQALPGNHPSTTNERVPTDGSVTPAKLAFAVPSQAEIDGRQASIVVPGWWTLVHTGTRAAMTLAADVLRVVPWYVPEAMRLLGLAVEVTTVGVAGSRVRLGVYADNDGLPGALLVDAGTVPGDATGQHTVAVDLQLGPGRYWVGGVTQLAATLPPALRVVTAPSPAAPAAKAPAVPAADMAPVALSMTGVAGALPEQFAAVPASSTAAPRLYALAG